MTHRRWAPLAAGWGWTAALVLVIAGLARWMPLAADLLQPVYVVALAPGVWGTWRWLRPRGDHDRRTDDRRHTSRRQ